MTGACVACGALGLVVGDHPEGRYHRRPLFSGTVTICARCNAIKGRRDRGAGVEAGEPSPRLLVARHAAWLGFMAHRGTSLLVPSAVFADRAQALQVVTRMIPPDLPWEQP